VILELGANDGLRALPIEQMRANLGDMVDETVRAGARVLLLGIRIPPNYGPEYTEKFYQVFEEVAHAKAVPRVPFLLADVALEPGLMQADGLHPNEQGQPKLLATVWSALKPLLSK
jgi:acyl-CoA thioesterase-1